MLKSVLIRNEEFRYTGSRLIFTEIVYVCAPDAMQERRVVVIVNNHRIARAPARESKGVKLGFFMDIRCARVTQETS